MYVCLSVCVSVSVCLYVYICLSVRPSVCLSVCMKVYMYVCKSVCLSVCLYVCLSIRLHTNTYKLSDRQAYRQTGIETNRHRDGHTGRLKYTHISTHKLKNVCSCVCVYVPTLLSTAVNT